VYITPHFLEQFITSALAEDIGDGDHSTLASIPAEAKSKARLLIKEEGILAGVELAQQIFKRFDPSLMVTITHRDGDSIT
jgi:nicotinate-nucleotide pyrophosphorylase (carboxylating)